MFQKNTCHFFYIFDELQSFCIVSGDDQERENHLQRGEGEGQDSPPDEPSPDEEAEEAGKHGVSRIYLDH